MKNDRSLKSALRASYKANIQRVYFQYQITSKSCSELRYYCCAEGLTRSQATDFVREIAFSISFLFSVHDDFEICRWTDMLTNIMTIDTQPGQVRTYVGFGNNNYQAVLCYYYGDYDGTTGQYYLSSIITSCHYSGCEKTIKDVIKRIARVLILEMACTIYQMIPACYLSGLNQSLCNYYEERLVEHSQIVIKTTHTFNSSSCSFKVPHR